jgi:hypothetical protein
VDHLTPLGVDDALVPAYHRAAATWRAGDHRAALEQLERSLGERLGGPVLGSFDPLLDNAAVDTFAAAVQWLLARPARMEAEPARVAAELWRQAPVQDTLAAVVLGDLRWSDDPFDAEPAGTPGAADLAALLEQHLAAGLIARDGAELPFAARPVLAPELLDQLTPEQLGPVATTLREAPAGDGDQWWRSAAELAPAVVLRAFVGDAFRGERFGGPAAAWASVRQRFPVYARAIRDAFTADPWSQADWATAGVVLTGGRSTDLRTDLAKLLGQDTV